MQVFLLAILAIIQSVPPSAPPMPYVDDGACPFECCTYRDWTAEMAHAVHLAPDTPLPRRVEFTIKRAERITAMTGIVITKTAGVARILRAVTQDLDNKGFPTAVPEKLTLRPGTLLYLLTNVGEGWRTAWYEGRVIESFDANRLGTAAECAKGEPCIGVLERAPVSEWWVQVRNSRGQIGWVLMPRGTRGFSDNDACGPPLPLIER